MNCIIGFISTNWKEILYVAGAIVGIVGLILVLVKRKRTFTPEEIRELAKGLKKVGVNIALDGASESLDVQRRRALGEGLLKMKDYKWVEAIDLF